MEWKVLIGLTFCSKKAHENANKRIGGCLHGLKNILQTVLTRRENIMQQEWTNHSKKKNE